MDSIDRKFQKLIRQMAKDNGVSVAEVKADIQTALTAAWTKPDKTEQEREHQAKIPCKGEIPTPEEFLHYMYENELSGLN